MSVALLKAFSTTAVALDVGYKIYVQQIPLEGGDNFARTVFYRYRGRREAALKASVRGDLKHTCQASDNKLLANSVHLVSRIQKIMIEAIGGASNGYCASMCESSSRKKRNIGCAWYRLGWRGPDPTEQLKGFVCLPC